MRGRGFLSVSWKLPPTPTHRLYTELVAELDYLGTTEPKEAMILFRAVAEVDFWFFAKYATSLGGYRCKEPHAKHYGTLYLDHPWLFERAREVQEDFELRRDRVWKRWHRFSFKTTLILKCGTLWILSRDAQETVGIWTHKVTQTGEGMGEDILQEIQQNQTLQDHWPQFRNLQEANGARITLDRELGPRDPSISVRPILGSSTGGRFSRMFCDDVIEEKIIESKQLVRKVDRAIARLFPLKGDDTPLMFLGTIWGSQDPMLRREREGYFTKVDHHPCFDKKGNPTIRSREFFLDQKKGMRTSAKDDFEWESQFMLRIVSRGGRYFRDEWRRFYNYTPAQMAVAMGSSVAIVIDPAGGEEDADYFTIRVECLGYDRNIYGLDLWREQELGETDVDDILFGTREANRDESSAWKPNDGLIPRWQKIDRHLVVWVEEFGASAWLKAFRKEAKSRQIDVTFRELPKLNRTKPSRIRFMQTPQREGRILDPLPVSMGGKGFGHGSKDDKRDTLDQYHEDEYCLWSLAEDLTAYGTVNDDMLDPRAWLFQPEVIDRLAWPFMPGGVEVGLGWPHSDSITNGSGGGVPASQASWMAY